MKIIKFLICLVVLIVLLGAGGQFFAGYYIKDQIGRAATEAVGAPVVVSQVRLSLLEGAGEITGLTIGNPVGYQSTEAFGIDRVRFNIDLASLMQSPIRIEEFTVQHARAVYEVDAQGKGNIQVLLENLSATTESDVGGEPQAPETENTSPAPQISIGNVSVANTDLTLDLQAIGKKRYAETLPEFSAENVGGEAGLPPAALGQEIVRVMLHNILKQTQDKYKNQLKLQLKDKLLKGIGSKLEGLLDKF